MNVVLMSLPRIIRRQELGIHYFMIRYYAIPMFCFKLYFVSIMAVCIEPFLVFVVWTNQIQSMDKLRILRDDEVTHRPIIHILLRMQTLSNFAFNPIWSLENKDLL
jgi:hypothetical protein